MPCLGFLNGKHLLLVMITVAVPVNLSLLMGSFISLPLAYTFAVLARDAAKFVRRSFGYCYGFDFWKCLEMPDIYKLSFEEKKLMEVEQIWERIDLAF